MGNLGGRAPGSSSKLEIWNDVHKFGRLEHLVRQEPGKCRSLRDLLAALLIWQGTFLHWADGYFDRNRPPPVSFLLLRIRNGKLELAHRIEQELAKQRRFWIDTASILNVEVACGGPARLDEESCTSLLLVE